MRLGSLVAAFLHLTIPLQQGSAQLSMRYCAPLVPPPPAIFDTDFAATSREDAPDNCTAVSRDARFVIFEHPLTHVIRGLTRSARPLRLPVFGSQIGAGEPSHGAIPATVKPEGNTDMTILATVIAWLQSTAITIAAKLTGIVSTIVLQIPGDEQAIMHDAFAKAAADLQAGKSPEETFTDTLNLFWAEEKQEASKLSIQLLQAFITATAPTGS